MLDKPEQFYRELEDQYHDAEEQGAFEILKLLVIDESHSDRGITEGIKYFQERNGIIQNDAPTTFLSQYELQMLGQRDGFRPKLYVMLLSAYFSEAIENKTIFLAHSFDHSFK